MSSADTVLHRVTVAVRGRVQGVGFRYWTVSEITQRRLPVTGSVRNLPDGSVEVIAESTDRGVLESLVRLLAEGPAHAHVLLVDPIYETDTTARSSSFRIE